MQRRPYRFKLAANPRADSLTSLAAAFCEHCRVRNYSSRTVEHHDAALFSFCAWTTDRGLLSPLDVTRPTLVSYQTALFHRRSKRDRPLAFSTQHRALVTIRSFFRWLAKTGVVNANPAADLDLPKVEQRLPKHVLTVTEVEAVMATVDLDDVFGVRDRSMLEVLYSTGMRRQEIAELRVTDIDDERGVVTVRQGKGKKDRTIPIGDRASAWVRRWLDEERHHWAGDPDDGVVFLTRDGEALGLNWLTRMVAGYVDAAAIGKRGSCHLFRHTMATLLLEGGADVRFIQEMLGHASMTTTQIYTRVSIQKLKAVHTMAHPAKFDRRASGGGLYAMLESAPTVEVEGTKDTARR
jgi:integrase/recombinase XerD